MGTDQRPALTLRPPPKPPIERFYLNSLIASSSQRAGRRIARAGVPKADLTPPQTGWGLRLVGGLR